MTMSDAAVTMSAAECFSAMDERLGGVGGGASGFPLSTTAGGGSRSQEPPATRPITLHLDCGCIVSLRWMPQGRRFVKIEQCRNFGCVGAR